MSKKLHLPLDADASSKALHSALLKLGHDVSRTPNSWMPIDASDEMQLLGATAQVEPYLPITFGILWSWDSIIRNMLASSLCINEA
jgi:hypothetical protein